MRRLTSVAIVGGLLIVVGLMNAGTSLATSSVGSTAQFTARATVGANHFDSDNFKVFQKERQDVVMRQLTFAANGGTSGWHSHPAMAYVIVFSGALTNYEVNDGACAIEVFGAGSGFTELPGEEHDVVNHGSVPAVIYVTYVDVPVGAAFRTDLPAPSPDPCPV